MLTATDGVDRLMMAVYGDDLPSTARQSICVSALRRLLAACGTERDPTRPAGCTLHVAMAWLTSVHEVAGGARGNARGPIIYFAMRYSMADEFYRLALGLPPNVASSASTSSGTTPPTPRSH